MQPCMRSVICRRMAFCSVPLSGHLSCLQITPANVFGGVDVVGAVLRDGARHVRISGDDVPVRADVVAIDSYSTHADRPALLEWLKARAPYSGSIMLVHGEDAALSTLAADIDAAPALRKAIVPELGRAWELRPGRAARLCGRPRPDARERIAPQDWISGLADLESGLAERLRALPSDAARERAAASLKRALERAEGR